MIRAGWLERRDGPECCDEPVDLLDYAIVDRA
jgi:hypothetical protein